MGRVHVYFWKVIENLTVCKCEVMLFNRKLKTNVLGHLCRQAKTKYQIIYFIQLK